MSMDYSIEHIGYVTKNIEKTAETFKVFGYQAGPIVDDDTQKTRICFLRKAGAVFSARGVLFDSSGAI